MEKPTAFFPMAHFTDAQILLMAESNAHFVDTEVGNQAVAERLTMLFRKGLTEEMRRRGLQLGQETKDVFLSAVRLLRDTGGF